MKLLTIPTKRITYFLPWVFLYFCIFGIAAASIHTVVGQYNERVIPAGSLELAVERSQYNLGESIAFTLSNHSGTPITLLRHCTQQPLTVYRWVNAEWRVVHSTNHQEECEDDAVTTAVPGGSSLTYTFDQWPELFAVPGVYRIAASVEQYPEVLFTDFVVMEEPEVVVIEDIVEVPQVIEQPAVSTEVEEEPLVDSQLIAKLQQLLETIDNPPAVEPEREREHDDDDEWEHEREHEDDDEWDD